MVNGKLENLAFDSSYQMCFRLIFFFGGFFLPKNYLLVVVVVVVVVVVDISVTNVWHKKLTINYSCMTHTCIIIHVCWFSNNGNSRDSILNVSISGFVFNFSSSFLYLAFLLLHLPPLFVT